MNPPAIMNQSNGLSKTKSFAQTQNSINAAKHAMGKLIQDKSTSSTSNLVQPSSHVVTQRNFKESNYASAFNNSSEKEDKKLIKSGSQVLGKARQRPKMTRGQMLKDLNDKKDKMSQLVEAAHATRCVSNEKGSSTKKGHSFTQKYANQQ